MSSIESRRTVPVKPSLSKRPGSSRKPVPIPIKSGRVKKSHVALGKALIKSKRSLKFQRKPLQCNQALYISPTAVEADRGDISPSSDSDNSTPKPVAISAGRGDNSHLNDQWRYVSQAVDDLLANLFTDDHITISQSPTSTGRPSNARVTSNSLSAR